MSHVEKRGDRYRARYRDPLGRELSRSFRRKADAERFLREMDVDVRRGNWVDPTAGETPLAVWADEFLLFARRLAPTSQDTYRRDITTYILPALGGIRIGRLRPDVIEHWLNDELDRGLAPSSVHRHYRTLRRMLQVAVDKERLAKNPCDRVDPPRVPKREMVFLTWSQALDLAEATHPHFRPLIYLAVDSGMRWSELIGLRRSRVDLLRRKVRVTEQLVRLADRTWLRKEPKTAAGVRSLTIAGYTAEILAAHLERLGPDGPDGPDGLVFPNKAGRPISNSSFHTAYFSKALAAVGFHCRFHDLRHTSVALAIAEGAHPKAIQARMGHSSINVTLDRYGHLFPELDEAIATSFDARLVEADSRRTATIVPYNFDRDQPQRSGLREA